MGFPTIRSEVVKIYQEYSSPWYSISVIWDPNSWIDTRHFIIGECLVLGVVSICFNTVLLVKIGLGRFGNQIYHQTNLLLKGYVKKIFYFHQPTNGKRTSMGVVFLESTSFEKLLFGWNKVNHEQLEYHYIYIGHVIIGYDWLHHVCCW